MKNKITKFFTVCFVALTAFSMSTLAGNGTAPDSAGVHKVGDAFGGGIIIQITTGADGKQHGLIAASENLDKAAWGANTSLKTDAASKTDGAANTAACMKAGIAKTEAAGICDSYEKDGFSDWFLPAVDQLEVLYKAFPVTKTPGPQFYWSSTSEYPGSAIGFDFNKGASEMSNKHRTGTVRPMRTF